MIQLIIISVFILIFNIPFGYWRANVKGYSFQWFLAIHIPVPFIITVRIFSDIGFSWHTYIFLVTAFFIGQKLGSIIHRYLEKIEIVSSCLIMDLKRILWEHE
ncbi:MAG: hypothetical protein PF485_05640 [Bacteroidales bacterium]|jgi:hypothetical protein|nr:hypothetical protein [Bacteroidales bacterium]